jgi:hypothetical protein
MRRRSRGIYVLRKIVFGLSRFIVRQCCFAELLWRNQSIFNTEYGASRGEVNHKLQNVP